VREGIGALFINLLRLHDQLDIEDKRCSRWIKKKQGLTDRCHFLWIKDGVALIYKQAL
jgi:hypothetical protein